jgi:hypothetical protein
MDPTSVAPCGYAARLRFQVVLHDEALRVLHPGPARVIAENEFAVGVRDSFPVSPGHTLVIPRCAGDTPDPRGGVRRVLPAKAKYRA